MKNIFLLLTSFLLFSITPAYAGGGALTGGATEWTQLANNAQLASIYGKSIEQVANQVRQIQYQIAQFAELSKQGTPMPDISWQDVLGQLMALEAATKKADDLAGGYGYVEDSVKRSLEEAKNRTGKESPREQEEKRSEAKQKTLIESGARIDYHFKQRKEDIEALRKKIERSGSAIGPMQAVQAGNEIAAQTTTEIIKLQENVDGLTKLILKKEQQEEEEKIAREKWIKKEIAAKLPTPEGKLPTYGTYGKGKTK